ncbi:unnamed protein product, partial [Brachionus calyciflorus]
VLEKANLDKESDLIVLTLKFSALQDIELEKIKVDKILEKKSHEIDVLIEKLEKERETARDFSEKLDKSRDDLLKAESILKDLKDQSELNKITDIPSIINRFEEFKMNINTILAEIFIKITNMNVVSSSFESIEDKYRKLYGSRDEKNENELILEFIDEKKLGCKFVGCDGSGNTLPGFESHRVITRCPNYLKKINEIRSNFTKSSAKNLQQVDISNEK